MPHDINAVRVQKRRCNTGKKHTSMALFSLVTQLCCIINLDVIRGLGLHGRPGIQFVRHMFQNQDAGNLQFDHFVKKRFLKGN